MTRNVLVTGSAGFIGSHVIGMLGNFMPVKDMVAVYRDMPFNREFVRNMHGAATLLASVDAQDSFAMERLVSKNEIDVIIHLAAQSIVKTAHRVPVYTIANNILSTLSVLETARKCDVERVIIQSTDKVYGNRIDATTDDPFDVTEPYAASKIASDVLAQCYAATYGMDIAITRPCNVYGYDWNNRLVPNTIRTCMKGERPFYFKDFNPKRQFVHVADLVASYGKIIREGHSGIINIAGQDVMGQEDVVRLIAAHFQLEPMGIEPPGIFEIDDQSLVPSEGFDMPSKMADVLAELVKVYDRYDNGVAET